MEPIRLSTIGGTELNGPDGRSILSILSQPKRFALLVYLAVAAPDGYVRRDRLIALFWPEHDTDRARANLSKGLSFLRKSLGPKVVLTRGDEEVGVDPELLRCDVVERGEARASSLAWPDADDGRFLDGFHFDGAPGEWDEWVEEVAEKVERLKEAPPAGAADSLDRSQLAAPVVGHPSAAQAADGLATSQRVVESPVDPGLRPGNSAGAVSGRSPSPWRLSIATAALAGVLAVTVVVLTSLLLDRPTTGVLHVSVPIAQVDDVILGGLTDARYGRPSSTSLAISPDGDLLVYSARDGAGTPEADSRLYSRRLDQARAERIPGTEGGSSPFFSPDGDWIGFFVGSSLKRVSVVDGTTETIVPEAPFGGRLGSRLPLGATWGDDGTIVFAGGYSLYQVAALGGEPELLAEAVLSGDREWYLGPHMLPGSGTLLVTIWRPWDPEEAEIVALDIATGSRKTLLSNAMDGRYVQTGHLLFMRQGVLMAVVFDVEGLEIQGQPVTILDDVMQALSLPDTEFETGAGQVAVSVSGHLAYARGGLYPRWRMSALRITSTGDTIVLDVDAQEFIFFRVSPDGNRLAFSAGFGMRKEIWVHDLVRGVSERLNTGGFSNVFPVWSPDGQWLAFTSDGELYRVRVDGSSEPERLAPSDRLQHPSSWSSQGVIAFLEAGDIWVLPPDGGPAPFFTSEADERYPTFSPDGDWLAYTSDQSGRHEVYARPYPGPEPATQISGGGGTSVAWSPDGRQIYYNQEAVLMAVDVTPGDEFQAGRPAPLIDPWTFRLAPLRGHDVFPDGSFVIAVADDGRSRLEQFGVTEFHVILNFFELLKERMGGN